jgi:hypothetical protein
MPGSNAEKLARATTALIAAAANDKLKIWGKWNNQTKEYDKWRITLAGTTYFIVRFGYEEDNLTYELHVHGNSKFRVNDSSHEAKVCGENLKGAQKFLSGEEWQLVKAKVKALVGQ